MKKANSRVPTFGAEGIVPSRRASTKKTEVSATAAMAEYAEEGQMGEGVRYRRHQPTYRAYRSGWNRRRV